LQGEDQVAVDFVNNDKTIAPEIRRRKGLFAGKSGGPG
jgi:hypothetical protein